MATAASRAAGPAAEKSGSAGKLFGFLLMAVGMFMAILDIQIVASSIQQVQAGLSASADEIVWVQTSYLVAEVVMIPLSAFLSRALSIKRLFVISCAGFTFSSFLCSTATSIDAMIVYRAMQGFIGGAMIPSVYAASFILFGREGSGKALVALGIIVTMAPTLGPVIGGWLTDNLSWHWLFLVNIVPGILITFGVWAFVDLDRPTAGLLGKIDLIGLIMMALFFGGLEFVLEEGPRHDWLQDPTVFRWAVAAIVGCIGFFWRAATAEEPIVRLKPFANFNFSAGTVLGAVLGIGLYGLVYIYPLYLSRIAGLSSSQIGATLVVTGISMVATAPLASVMVRKIDPRKMLCAGFLLMAASTWMTTGITDQWRFGQLFLPQIFRGVGVIICIIATSNAAFATLTPEDLKDASGLFTLMRNLGGAFGLAMLNTGLLWRYNLHWGRLGEAINPGRPEVQARLDLLGDLASAQGSADPGAAAIRQMAAQVGRQALVMSYADCFAALTVLFAVVAVIPLCLRRPATIGQPAPSGH